MILELEEDMDEGAHDDMEEMDHAMEEDEDMEEGHVHGRRR
jgi:hypothetical protein